MMEKEKHINVYAWGIFSIHKKICVCVVCYVYYFLRPAPAFKLTFKLALEFYLTDQHQKQVFNEWH